MEKEICSKKCTPNFKKPGENRAHEKQVNQTENTKLYFFTAYFHFMSHLH